MKRCGGKQILRYILRLVLFVAVSVVLGVNLYDSNAKRLMGDPMPMPFGWGASVVLSGSMEPTLRVDDLIIVREAESYDVGDIAVYQSGQGLVVHRIIAMTDDAVIFQGDANNTADDPVAPDVIRGAVVYIVPRAGAIALALQTPLATIGMLALAIGLIELSFMQERRRDRKTREGIEAEIRRLKGEMQGNGDKA